MIEMSEPRINWSRNEVILACAILVDNNWSAIPATDDRIVALSELLQRSPEHPVENRGDKFRNVNGVARKIADLQTHHPHYHGVPTHGSKIDLEVLAAFINDSAGMIRLARRIREEIEHGRLTTALIAEIAEDPDMAAAEGTILMASHIRRDRDPKLRRAKIARAKANGGQLACEVCGLSFEDVYGERGRDYIEVHHVTPLHVSGATTTRMSDLALICANCHRMIHRGTQWLTPTELRDIVNRQRTHAGQH